MQAARIEEIFNFAALASGRLRESSELVGPFRAALEEFHPEVFRAMESADVPQGHFRFSEAPMSDDPIADFSSSLGQAAESDSGLSHYLASAVGDGSLIEPGAAS